jgi:hypothetical protein
MNIAKLRAQVLHSDPQMDTARPFAIAMLQRDRPILAALPVILVAGFGLVGAFVGGLYLSPLVESRGELWITFCSPVTALIVGGAAGGLGRVALNRALKPYWGAAFFLVAEQGKPSGKVASE